MPESPAAIVKRIEEISAILEAGAPSVTLDGLTVSWDCDALRTERAELEKQLPVKRKRRRPFSFGNNLGGAF